MKSWIAAAAGCLALLTGCSGQPQNTAGGGQNQMPAGNAVSGAPAAPETSLSGEARFQRLAECSAILASLGNLYDAIASTERGAEKAELEQRARDRRAEGTIFGLDAYTAGRPLGRTPTDIDRIKAETTARIRREQARIPDFSDFGIWLAREADRCAVLNPAAG